VNLKKEETKWRDKNLGRNERMMNVAMALYFWLKKKRNT
jgi:hypothetical protein